MPRATSVLLVMLLIHAVAHLAHAANSVTIESKKVMIGAKDVKIGVFLENDVPITSLSYPFEFRSLTPESYVTNKVIRRWNHNSRLSSSFLHQLCYGNPDSPIDYVYPSPASQTCSGPKSNTYAQRSLNNAVDFQSPDGMLALLYDCGTFDSLGFTLLPGADPRETDSASRSLTFDVTSIPGQFIIDTCCIAPATHLLFVDTLSNLIIPLFTPGIITIACECPCLDDPYCDGEGPDLRDVVATIDVAFGGVEEKRDEFCPAIRTDFDCSGYTNIVDVVRLISVAFREANPATELCQPCASP